MIRILSAVLLSSVVLVGTQGGPTASAQPGAPPQGSAVVLPDHRTTFRLRLPSVSNIQLVIDGRPAVPMQKEADGTWTATVGPLEPATYKYWFSVDGLAVVDPSNPSGALRIGGDRPLPWEIAHVPHGAIHQHFYQSQIGAYERDYYVYTPPGYEKSRDRYPVLYLLHGNGGASVDWITTGRVHMMLDNLLAEGKARPMLLVMPIGYGMADYLQLPRTAATRRESFTKFTAALLSEMIPMVEQNYRVESSARSRAIAGLSMGAAEALFVGLSNPDRFGAVGAFSSGQIFDLDFDSAFPSLDSEINSKTPLIRLGCGTDDDTIINNRRFRSWLTTKGVVHLALESPGFHEWPVWRRHFLTFAPLLFRR